MKENEYPLLSEFLYNAIYIPKGVAPPSKAIIEKEELRIYVENFGEEKDDRALVAEVDGRIVGACWVRIMNDYGHIDDNTPSLAISLYKEYRNMGIGTELLKSMLEYLKNEGYGRVSLSVQKENYAAGMYIKCGFKVVAENEQEYIMLCEF